jgi:hypothetical protein
MKNINIYKSLLMILFLCGLFSCKKDDLNSKELLTFIKSDGSDIHISNLVFKRSMLSATGDSVARIAAYLTREISSDVVVNIGVDENLVSDYNTANKTKLVLLPAANYKFTGSSQLTVRAGSVVSADSLKIQLVDRMKLTDDNGYVLPLSIREVSGKDKGAKASENYRTVFVVVKGSYSNIADAQLSLDGTVGARTSWVLSVSNTTAGALGPAMVDNNNTTAWRSSNSSTAVKWVSVDMGTAQQIKGFRLVPNYVAVAENATAITVSTSMDNVTWTAQGSWKGTGPSATSSAASPDIKNINFIVPVQARYFKLDITAWTSGSRVGIGELNVVQ